MTRRRLHQTWELLVCANAGFALGSITRGKILDTLIFCGLLMVAAWQWRRHLREEAES